MTEIKRWYSENTNPEKLTGAPAEVIEGCDLFFGVSGPGLIDAETSRRWPTTRSSSRWPTRRPR